MYLHSRLMPALVNMPRETQYEATLVRKQTTGEQAWVSLLSLLSKFIDRVKLKVPETLVFGWMVKKPLMLYSDDSGVLRGRRDVSLGYVTDFLTYCVKEDHCPLCVARQTCSFAVTDSKSAMTLWHKNVAVSRPIFLQRYVTQHFSASTLTRAHWKPQSTHFLTLTNLVPYTGPVRRRSVIALGRLAVTLEDKTFTREAQASISEEVTYKRELQHSVDTLVNMYKSEFNDAHTQLSELVAEFIQETDNWFLIRVVSFELAKNLGSTVPELTRQRLRMRQRSWNDGQYKHLSIKRMSETILSIKQSLGMSITPEDRQRLASYTDFAKKLRTPLPHLVRRQNTRIRDETPTYLMHESSPLLPHSLSIMPPLFQFPTPRDNESFHIPRVEEIKEHIKRQNNSLYTRIHYQEPDKNQGPVDQSVKLSVSFGAEEFDRLRELGVAGRDLLRNRETEVFHPYSLASESSFAQD